IVGPDVTPTLFQDPRSGAAVEVVPTSVVTAALRKAQGAAAAAPRQDDGTRERARKAKIEKAFRAKLYAALRQPLTPPSLRAIAETMFDRLEFDQIKELCKVRGFEPPMASMYGRKERDHRAIGKTIIKLDDAGLVSFINDCIYVRELLVPTWSDRKPEK